MNSNDNKIAVIGMACRFPGANNINEYWNNLINGRDTIKRFTDEEISESEADFNELKNNPNYVKARGVLDDIDKFDAEFFGMTSEEADDTDPQHRVWLEVAWEALENAGCNPYNYEGGIGVFAGGAISTYLLNYILKNQTRLKKYLRYGGTKSLQMLVENDPTHIPTKTAYQFNLKGPAINVQTACSTSLMAITQACQSLTSFESDICLAGGVCIVVPQERGYVYEVDGISSPDGYCRAFDIKAQGTVLSNGIGIVILKRLEDALHDRDLIYAVVSGWAVNNDGKNKVSYMAPSVDGQAEVIMMAQSFAGITPDRIGYIEAHGTATQLGDPIEITALKKAFSKKTDKKQFCGIGSVKSNVGHTDVAAGVASFIKSCMAVYNRKIPPTINFKAPNKYIKFEKTPFYVQHQLKEWTDEKPLIIGVSSFGIGGTNVHVIIEEPPRRNKSEIIQSEFPELIVLSARSRESLERRKRDLIDFININSEADLRDISYTLATGRAQMPFRSFIVATDKSEINSIDKFNDGIKDDLISKIAFMFPGEGAQYKSMGQDLYKSSELFRKILDECSEIIKSETGEDLSSLLLEEVKSETEKLKLSRKKLLSPALFTIEYALVKLLDQMQIRPDFLIGYGVGEFTAACVSGVFDLESALKIIIKRSNLIYKFVSSSIDLNAVNYSNAVNSNSLAPVLPGLDEYINQFRMSIPKIPLISCTTGNFMTPEDAVSGNYWAQQLNNIDQFKNGISITGENDDVLFLEVGPDTCLSSIVRENSLIKNKKAIIPIFEKPDSVNETYKFMIALGKIFTIGLEPDYIKQSWNKVSKKINLPTYPFKRERHWINYDIPGKVD